MKTLKQWYDGLSEKAQERIKEKCILWFDPEQPDYYRKRDKVSKDMLTSLLETDLYAITRKYNLSYGDEYARKFQNLFMLAYLVDGGIISEQVADKAIMKDYCKHDRVGVGFLFVSDKNRDEAYKQYIGYDSACRDSWNRIDFFEYLYLIKDFDTIGEIDWNYVVKPVDLDYINKEIIGPENTRKLALKDCIDYISNLRCKEESPLFDELFYETDDEGHPKHGCWDSSDRDRIVSWYLDSRHTDLKTTEDFIYRFVCVNPKKYLPKLYNIIEGNPVIGTMMFTQKKDLTEIQEKHLKGEAQYKYCREVRSLAKIINSCVRKAISNQTQKQLKEYGPLVKLYGYDFWTIYNAMEIDL